MSESPRPNQPPSMFERMRQTLVSSGMPTDDRGRMRMVVDSLVLHLHPAKVPVITLKWTYTWGLGGLSALLISILALTGIFLQMNYTPSPDQAYLDILALRSDTWFGELLRNIHHWSANLLILVSVLHLLRVFFTGAHRPPRELNWLLGVAMLLLVLGANFTGYLLPWDQLAFWAITVGTSILNYIPLIGGSISRLLLGGPEVGASTLLNFYSLHISFIPLSIMALMSYHFWRVRKDGGLTIPRSVDGGEEPKMERVTTIPNLVRRELVWAVSWIGILLIWSMFVPAPLEGIANPLVSPNPAKAPWYFLGIQELLLHFHPLVGAIVLPGMAMAGLALLPFYDTPVDHVGVYFRSHRGRALAVLSSGLALLAAPAWVLIDEFVLDWAGWFPGLPTLVSNGLIPLALILLGLVLFERTFRTVFKADREERILAIFVFLTVSFLVLTVIGIFFRGEGMMLVWPWEITSHSL